MSRTVQEISTDLLTTGLNQHQLSLLVELLASVTVVRQSADIADERRRKDREYQRLKREKAKQNKGKAEANDTASVPISSADNLPTIADERCDLLSLGKKEKRTSEEGSKKEKISGSARGTRLSAEVQLSLGDLDFALSVGMTETEARHAWAEFVDYWIGVPGQRGTKLNWSATWRNRCRELAKRKRTGKSQQITWRSGTEGVL